MSRDLIERLRKFIATKGLMLPASEFEMLALVANELDRIAVLETEAVKHERALITVQNAAKTLASARGTELEHLRQNHAFDHKLRAEHDSLIERDALMTDALLKAEARIAALEAEASEAGCMCRGVEIGSHMASVSLPIPEHMADYREARVAAGLSPMISVDACLVVELRLLWARGIRTYGSCCGHNKVRGMVNVHEDDTAAMLAMGYAQWPEKDGMAVATFYPKSVRGVSASEGERRGLERALEFANFEAEAWGYADGSSARVAAANIARAIRELPEAPAQEGWRPIETAPRDGTVVWVWCPSYENLDSLTSLASWHEDAGWCVDELRTPTMWCPLQVPAPPSQDREPDSQRGAK